MEAWSITDMIGLGGEQILKTWTELEETVPKGVKEGRGLRLLLRENPWRWPQETMIC